MPGVYDVLDVGVAIAQQTAQVDYTDLLWLPSRLHLRPQRYKHVLVDEAQDLNAAQLALVLDTRARAGPDALCGDPHQSIYGWIGADPEAYARIKTVTRATELPLPLCYRCPTSRTSRWRGRWYRRSNRATTPPQERSRFSKTHSCWITSSPGTWSSVARQRHSSHGVFGSSPTRSRHVSGAGRWSTSSPDLRASWLSSCPGIDWSKPSPPTKRSRVAQLIREEADEEHILGRAGPLHHVAGLLPRVRSTLDRRAV